MTVGEPYYPKWYECIEEPVRDIVYKLRNAGFNTTNSCGHDMWIEIDMPYLDLYDLYTILQEEWGKFILEFYWEGTDLYRSWVRVNLGDKNESICTS